MNRPLIFVGMWLLSGAIAQGALADNSAQQQPADYTILLKQLRVAEKLTADDLVQYHAVSESVQGNISPLLCVKQRKVIAAIACDTPPGKCPDAARRPVKSRNGC